MIPYESDPELRGRLYERFDYLRGHLLRLRSVPNTIHVGTLAPFDLLVSPLADKDYCKLPSRSYRRQKWYYL